jgi:ATP-dependent DNA helicase RecQ
VLSLRTSARYAETAYFESTNTRAVKRVGTIFLLDRRRATMPSSSSMSVSLDDNVRTRLRTHFGHREFRQGQEEIVAAVLGGRDLLAVMPTGSGKSLGYQLPAVMLPGTTLVVSPLISLMKDQVDELSRRGIGSASLHSMLSADNRREVLRAARAGALRLLYVAPERFASDQFLRLLGELDVARFVVDEAHCVSEWGHDFRPDYRRLRAAAGLCRTINRAAPRPPIAAFTATATPEVRADIVALLGLEEPKVLVAGFDRPNIYLRVERAGGDEDKNDLLPGLVRGRRALVYAATRKTTEAAAQLLQGSGVKAAVYHAGLEDGERMRVQDAFAAGSLPVVCATNAFGMGIDRPDVDAVVHYAIPGSVEAYYQEIGRGGRDGRAATATLLWDPGDVATRQFLIDSPRRDRPGHRSTALDPAEVARRRELEHRKLQRRIDYADSSACLRATILRYFGDPAVREPCGSCGVCRPGAIDTYERALVLNLLAGIARAGERYGRHRIVAMLRGDTDDLPPSLTKLSTTGVLRQEPADAVYRWIEASIAAGLVVVSKGQYRTLSLSEEGREVLRRRIHDLQIRRPSTPPRLLASRRYRDDLSHELRAELRFRSRAGRFGPWDTDTW